MIANNLDSAVASNRDASLSSPSSPTSLQDATKRCKEAFQKWYALYSDPQVWTDPAKRSAMYRARLGYQDASMEWVKACRKTS
jgi:hypothetical protein